MATLISNNNGKLTLAKPEFIYFCSIGIYNTYLYIYTYICIADLYDKYQMKLAGPVHSLSKFGKFKTFIFKNTKDIAFPINQLNDSYRILVTDINTTYKLRSKERRMWPNLKFYNTKSDHQTDRQTYEHAYIDSGVDLYQEYTYILSWVGDGCFSALDVFDYNLPQAYKYVVFQVNRT